MPNILIIEDDPILARNLSLYVRAESYASSCVATIADAEAKLAADTYDLLLLDVGLPDGNGIEFCRRLRVRGVTCPILLLTALGSEENAVSGLGSGANDFIRKPYSMRELASRIRIHLFGARPSHVAPIHQFAGLEIDLARGRARHAGNEIELSRTKLRILDYLVEHANHIVSRDALLQHLSKETEVYDRTIDAHISQLRRVLRMNGLSHIQIASIYGAGYKIENLREASSPL